jgi:hypothetical protein
MSGYLRRARALSSNLLQVLFDLHAPRTRSFQVLLRVALDLRLSMLATLNLITQALQFHR